LKFDLQQQYQKTKTVQLKCVNQLFSHNSRINDLKFSPWCHPNAPIILVSISAEVVFWNVTIVLNNQMDNLKNRPQRRSHRFSRGNLLLGNRALSNGNGDSNSNDSSPRNSKQFTNPWQQKTGTSDKPELLACIKFVGNEARQLFVNEEFTKFLTIDNEGNIFFLRLIEDFSHFLKVTPPPVDK
jgi:apoptotic protease-activating factor